MNSSVSSVAINESVLEGMNSDVSVDFRKKKSVPITPIQMKGENIEIIDTYKYLGVTIDSKLNWSHHIDKVFKKSQSRLFFLRKLRSFNVCNRMLCMFYDTIICSVLSFALVCWGGNATERDKGRLNKLIKKAGGCVGQNFDDIDSILEKLLLRKAIKIEKEEWHPLHSALVQHRSRINSRSKYILPAMSSDRYRKSFVPSSLKLLNAKK